MKRNIFSKCLYGMMALGLLASCSNEPLLEDNKVLENETTTYIRLTLLGDGASDLLSRETPEGENEGVYEDGDANYNESAVGEILLAFYDDHRNFIATQSIKNVPAASAGNNDLTVEKIITVVSPVNLPGNVNHPAWVVAFVNPTNAAGDLEIPLENLMTRLRERKDVSWNGYRTMNNSVYYDETTGNVRYATPVNFENQFYLTEDEARAAGAEAIEITVERVEAKVKTQLPSTGKVKPVNASGKDNEGYSLKFVPQAWFVNATEKSTFLIKNYRATRANYTIDTQIDDVNATSYSMKFSALNGLFRSGLSFNSQKNKRSFWAIDPTYFFADSDVDNSKDLYPEVSYDIKNYQEKVGDKTINPDANVTAKFPLLYRSFDVALKEYQDHVDSHYIKFDEDGNKTHEYVLENTMSLATLLGPEAMSSMTSVELIGYYVVSKGEEVIFDGSAKTDGSGFYVRNEGSPSAPEYRIMLDDKEAINYFLEHAGNMLFVQKRNQNNEVMPGEYEILKGGHLKNSSIYGVSYEDFDLVYPTTDLTGNEKKLSEQWRTLSLNNKDGHGVNNTNIFIQVPGAGTYRNLTAEEWRDLAKRFYITFGVVERFCEGKAHFTVPLKHIWGAAKSGNSVFDASDLKLGDYGVVRNHIYDLTINEIKGLGTGIGDPEQPIVPPTNSQQYYISTKLNILKWRKVSQSVDL